MKEKIAQLVSWIQARTPIQWAAAFAVLITLTAVTVTISSYVRQKNNIETCSTPNCLPASPTPLTLQAATPTPSPKTVPALLDGVGVEPGSDALRPLAVMIENHPEARPQSGLNSASIVYEALAEGGITRFMALYRDARQPVRVGPVRSARVYYVELANEYGAFYAHAGGNSFALALIDQTNTYDIDGLNIGAPQFTRDRSRTLFLNRFTVGFGNKNVQLAEHLNPTKLEIHQPSPTCQQGSSPKSEYRILIPTLSGGLAIRRRNQSIHSQHGRSNPP
jgi:hypothetical protein